MSEWPRDDFRSWLKSEAYRPATIRKVLTDLGSLVRNPELGSHPDPKRRDDYRWVWKLYGDFALDRRAPPLKVPCPERVPTEERRRHGRKARRKAKRGRKDEAVSIPPKAWAQLVELVRADKHPTARVLEVMMGTALRVGDVLRIPARPLLEAFCREDGVIVHELKGGKRVYGQVLVPRVSWQRLSDLVQSSRARNVARAVSSSADPGPGGAAYAAVRRRWHRHCRDQGLKGRHNLHRLRRTVAVRLREQGVALEDVQAVLGHENLATTAGYTDEYQARVVASALKKLGGFGGS